MWCEVAGVNVIAVRDDIIVVLVTPTCTTFLSYAYTGYIAIRTTKIAITEGIVDGVSIPLFAGLTTLLDFDDGEVVTNGQLPSGVSDAPVGVTVVFALEVVFQG